MSSQSKALAESLIVHESRMSARVYRPLLGHEQAHLVRKAELMLEANADKITVLLEAGRFGALRIIIKSVRRLTLTYLLAQHRAS